MQKAITGALTPAAAVREARTAIEKVVAGASAARVGA
jgi:hypothetical protein